MISDGVDEWWSDDDTVSPVGADPNVPSTSPKDPYSLYVVLSALRRIFEDGYKLDLLANTHPASLGHFLRNPAAWTMSASQQKRVYEDHLDSTDKSALDTSLDCIWDFGFSSVEREQWFAFLTRSSSLLRRIYTATTY